MENIKLKQFLCCYERDTMKKLSQLWEENEEMLSFNKFYVNKKSSQQHENVDLLKN